MEPYASQLSSGSFGAPLYAEKHRSCVNKSALAKMCGALVSVLLLAAAIGLGLYFVGNENGPSNAGPGGVNTCPCNALAHLWTGVSRPAQPVTS